MKANTILKKILSDLRVELSDEFDRNFTRKAFFDRPWKPRQRNGRGTLLVSTGRLRRSIRCRQERASLVWSSDAEYAAIHNEGGTITVTPKMRKYFWFRYKQATAKLTFNTKTRKATGTRNARLSAEALFWRNMAISKKGKITIPQRRFIGDHPIVTRHIDRIVGATLDYYFSNELKQTKR